ncbi:MAG TPA: serine/threonine-protein kinase [Gaiellaceae bacterium]|nr:serine/threonine-protein kinase [Gaiellaceae bacterium]
MPPKAVGPMSTGPAPVPENTLMVGRYRPLRPLGTGGSGSVWLAIDEETGLEVALKVVAKEGTAGSRAEREAKAATALRHPHCLRAYGCDNDHRHVYIAYEYVPGHTLRHALREGRLDDAAALEAAAQVLDALAYAHAHGIVHRDVKPTNVLLTEEAKISVRLFDFGLAQMADAETLTAVGDVPGTLAYISPERLHGEPAGPPADVWAVGVLLWEALSGQHPFWQSSPLETGRQIKAGAPSLREARPDLPRRLLSAVDRALAVEPERRPSAAALADVLRGAPQKRVRRQRLAKPQLPRGGRALAIRAAPAAFGALLAAWVAATLPFYPARWPALLAFAAAALTALVPRVGLAFVLAVPVFPLGNLSFGLALVYAAVAVAWLALAWRVPRTGLIPVAGALLAPIGLLGLMPLLLWRVPGVLRRFVYGSAAVLVAALFAGMRGAALPFGAGRVQGLGIAGAEDPRAVAEALWSALVAHPGFARQVVVVGVAAALLPYAFHGGELAIAAFGAAFAAASLLAAPEASAWPAVLCAWTTSVALLAVWRARGGSAVRWRALGTLQFLTHANFVDRLKPGGGPGWPQRVGQVRPR